MSENVTSSKTITDRLLIETLYPNLTSMKDKFLQQKALILISNFVNPSPRIKALIELDNIEDAVERRKSYEKLVTCHIETRARKCKYELENALLLLAKLKIDP
jgi:hypothetical protein